MLVVQAVVAKSNKARKETTASQARATRPAENNEHAHPWAK
jgi:hypothetical protein